VPSGVLSSIQKALTVTTLRQKAKTALGAVYFSIVLSLFGGAREDRTPDLLNAIQALSHLSYDPTGNRSVTASMGAV
jgi:hypothetical protein